MPAASTTLKLSGLMSDRQRDLDLIGCIAGGDQAALRDLYTIYGQRLYAYAQRLAGDQQQAEDVVQDALVPPRRQEAQ